MRNRVRGRDWVVAFVLAGVLLMLCCCCGKVWGQ
jgi:hypothetical protein